MIWAGTFVSFDLWTRRVQHNRAVHFSLFQETTSLRCFAQWKNAIDGGAYLTLFRSVHQKLHTGMKQVRPREETRNVEPSQRLRLLHKPTRNKRLS